MRLLTRIVLFFGIGAGLLACSVRSHVFYQGENLPVDTSYQAQQSVEKIVNPYRDSLNAKMNQVIGNAGCDMTNERPEGNLGNYVADICLTKGKELLDEVNLPVICVLNFGGLRASISKGEITLGEVYQLMPFDNELVFVKLKAEKYTEIRNYLINSGGEPIAGFRLYDDTTMSSDFWVVTSDFLAHGGDKMNFFFDPISYKQTGVLLRDVIKDAIENEQTVCSKLDGRLTK